MAYSAGLDGGQPSSSAAALGNCDSNFKYGAGRCKVDDQSPIYVLIAFVYSAVA